jgi:hypothetical protein
MTQKETLSTPTQLAIEVQVEEEPQHVSRQLDSRCPRSALTLHKDEPKLTFFDKRRSSTRERTNTGTEDAAQYASGDWKAELPGGKGPPKTGGVVGTSPASTGMLRGTMIPLKPCTMQSDVMMASGREIGNLSTCMQIIKSFRWKLTQRSLQKSEDPVRKKAGCGC